MRIQVTLEVKTGEPDSQGLVSGFDLIFDADRGVLWTVTRQLTDLLVGWARFYLENIPGVVSLEVINYSEEVTQCRT